MILWVSRLESPGAFANRDVLYAAMTRFNVSMPTTPGAMAIRERGGVEAWTLDRIRVFRECCLRPMLNQHLRPHTWVILFDKEMSPPVVQLVEELGVYDWIVPLPCGNDWTERAAGETRAVFRERFGERRFQWIACARLDSDDSLHAAFYAAVDHAISKRRRSWTPETAWCIDFPYGAMRSHNSLIIQLKEKHAFVLIEPLDQFRTPYFCEHTHIDRYVPLVSILTDRPMFIYQRHDANISGRSGQATWDEFADPERGLGYFELTPDQPAAPAEGAGPDSEAVLPTRVATARSGTG